MFSVVAANSSAGASQSIDLGECRKNIQKAICLLGEDTSHLALRDRECLAGASRYVPEFEFIFDNYPIVLQATFCGVERIYIQPDLDNSAYSNFSSRHIGVKQDLLDQKLSLAHWASWREQLAFGADQTTYRVSETLPVINSYPVLEGRLNDFLYYVVAHELAHILDIANDLNGLTARAEDDGLAPRQGSFAAISWEAIYNAKPDKVSLADDFHLRDELCFYRCVLKSNKRPDIGRVYREAYQSSFISLYAAQDPWEDFAETLAFVVLIEYLGQKYSIEYDGVKFDLATKMRSETFSQKRQFVVDFLNKRELKFP